MRGKNGSRKQKFMETLIVHAGLITAMLLLNSNPALAASKLSQLTNNEWIKLVANTLMLGAILFVIYIYSVPSEKDDKSKRGIIILAVVALCGVMAYQFMTDVWFWQVPIVKAVFHLKVITNILVTGAFFFAVLTLAQTLSDSFKSQMQQTASKYAAIVIILFLTFNVALGPFFKNGEIRSWSEVKQEYDYVWNKPDVKSVITYMIGDSKCVDDEGRRYCYYEKGSNNKEIVGYGILRPPYIIVFFLGFLLTIWSFKTFNFVTDIKWLQYIFAFLISAGVAHNGLSIRGFARIAQIVTVLVVRKSLVAADSDMNKGLSWGISIAIVGTVMHYVFPDYQYVWFDWVFSFGTVMGWIILVAGGFFLGSVIAGITKKNKDRSKSRFWSDFRVNSANWIKRNFLKGKWTRAIRAIPEFLGFTFDYESPQGEINPIFRELSVEFMIHMDYMLRMHVFTGKYSVVKQLKEETQKAYAHMVGKHTFDSAFKELMYYKWGSGYKIDKDGIVVKASIPSYAQSYDGKQRVVPGKGQGEKMRTGAMVGYNHWYQLFLGVKALLEPTDNRGNSKIVDEASQIANVQKTVQDKLEEFFMGDVPASENSFGKIAGAKKDGNVGQNRVRRYGAVNVIDSIRKMILDQYLMAGAYMHTYIFGHPEAEVMFYKFEEEENKRVLKEVSNGRSWNKYKVGLGHRIKPVKRAFLRKEKLGWLDKERKILHEVTPEGYVVADLNDLELGREKGVGGGMVRRIRKEDMLWGDFNKVMNWLDLEWQAFIDDLRDGRYHPFSRKVKDYVECHKKADFAYSTLSKIKKYDPPSRSEPAFDREALKNPGMFKYWGRKKYYDVDFNSINEPNRNPYPTISTVGMSQYLKDLVISKTKSEQEAVRNLARYVYDTGGKEKNLFTSTPTEASAND